MNQEEEIQKCKEDPVYFYETYFTINGKKPPKLTDMQKEVLKACVLHDYVIIGKGRTGFKTLMKQVVTAHLPDFVKPPKLIE